MLIALGNNPFHVKQEWVLEEQVSSGSWKGDVHVKP